jgi:hypothetical protein
MQKCYAIGLVCAFYEGSGGGEIRTHEAFQPSGFQDRRNQPLCHPSKPSRSTVAALYWRRKLGEKLAKNPACLLKGNSNWTGGNVHVNVCHGQAKVRARD